MDNKNYQDHFFFKAKTLGYRSRSALKLIELNKKFKFLKNGLNILDVGSYPGGWCQVIQKKNNKGKTLGIDLKKTEQIEGIKLIEGDFLDTNSKKKINEYFATSIDLILSDMASNTTGNKGLDSMRTNQLCLDILDFSNDKLSKNGVVVSKFFMGEEFNEIKIKAKKTLKKSIFLNQSQAEVSQEKAIYIVVD